MAVMTMLAYRAKAENDHGDPNCAVVDVIHRTNRLIDVDPGDQFWLSVPLDSPIGSVKVDIDGMKGQKLLKPGESLAVKFDRPGTYKIRMRSTRGVVLEPFTVTVFAPPVELEQDQSSATPWVMPDTLLATFETCTTPITRVSMGSVYAGVYLVGGSPVNRYPIRLRANGCGTATLTKYPSGWSHTYSFTNELSSTGWQEISALIDVPVGQTWTIKIQYGGTHTLSTNMPGRLTINDLILTEGPSYAPVGQSVTNMTWFALTNDVVGVSVLPGPFWVTNSPTATADLFDWTVNSTLMSSPSDLTFRFSPGLGTNDLAVSCHTPGYGPVNQATEVEGCFVQIAVDANRDNQVLFDGTDQTTAEKPFKYWTNDGRDGLYHEEDWNGYVTNSVSIPIQDALDPSDGPPNYSDQIINGTRDLENMARVTIHLEGTSLINAVASNMVTIGMAWRPMFSDDNQGGWDPTGSDRNPKINLFAMAPVRDQQFPSGGREYLDDVETGVDQIKVLQLGDVIFGYGLSKGSVGKSEPVTIPSVF